MNTFLSIRDLHKKVTATVVDGSPLKTSLPCIAAAHIQSSSVRAKMQPMTRPDGLNPALGRRDCDSPYPPLRLTVFQQPPHRQPAPSPTPGSTGTIQSRQRPSAARARAWSRSQRLSTRPNPLVPQVTDYKNITASVCILVQGWGFFFGSTWG